MGKEVPFHWDKDAIVMGRHNHTFTAANVVCGGRLNDNMGQMQKLVSEVIKENVKVCEDSNDPR